MEFVKTGNYHQEIGKGGVKETETDTRHEDVMMSEQLKMSLPEFQRKNLPSHVLADEAPPEGYFTEGDNPEKPIDNVPAAMTEDDIEFLRSYEKDVQEQEAKKRTILNEELQQFRQLQKKGVLNKESISSRKVTNKESKVKSLFGRKGALSEKALHVPATLPALSRVSKSKAASSISTGVKRKVPFENEIAKMQLNAYGSDSES